MEPDGYDFPRLLELDTLIDPREWQLEAINDGHYRIVRVVDGQAYRVWGNSNAVHHALVEYLKANGVNGT